MILTGKSLNIYGINSTDLEEKKKKGKLSENMCLCQLQNQTQACQSCWSRRWNNWPPNLPAASSSTCRLQLCHAVTLSTALINNMLTLGRKRFDFIFSNSWEVRRWWEELSRSQLTVTLPALTQHMTDVTLDGCHRCCLKNLSKWENI